MIELFFQSVTQAYSGKENPSAPNRNRTNDLPITSSDAPRLSNRRLEGAKVIKLGSIKVLQLLTEVEVDSAWWIFAHRH